MTTLVIILLILAVSLVILVLLQGSDNEGLGFGGGGASKAVEAAFLDLGIKYMVVSRQRAKGDLVYAELKSDPSYIEKVDMIVNKIKELETESYH